MCKAEGQRMFAARQSSGPSKRPSSFLNTLKTVPRLGKAPAALHLLQQDWAMGCELQVSHQKTWETSSGWTWAAAPRGHSMLQLCQNYILQWFFDLFIHLISNCHPWVNLNHSPQHSYPRVCLFDSQVVSSLRFQSSRTSIISKQKGKADLRKTVDTLQKLQNKIYGKKILQGEWEWELCLFNLERESHHLQMGEHILQGAVTRSSSGH